MEDCLHVLSFHLPSFVVILLAFPPFSYSQLRASEMALIFTISLIGCVLAYFLDLTLRLGTGAVAVVAPEPDLLEIPVAFIITNF